MGEMCVSNYLAAGILTQSAAKFADKPRVYAYADRF